MYSKLVEESLQERLTVLGHHVFTKVCEEHEGEGERKPKGRKPSRGTSFWRIHFPRSSARGVSRISWKQVHLDRVYRVSGRDRETLAMFCFATARREKNGVFPEHALRLCLFNAGGETKKNRCASDDPVRHWLTGVSARERLLNETTARFYIKRGILRDAHKRESRIALQCLQSFRDHRGLLRGSP